MVLSANEMPDICRECPDANVNYPYGFGRSHSGSFVAYYQCNESHEWTCNWNNSSYLNVSHRRSHESNDKTAPSNTTAPTSGGVSLYRMFDASNKLLYVGISKDFGSRWKQHAHAQPWWGDVQNMTVAWYLTREDAEAAEKIAIEEEKPRYNVVYSTDNYAGQRTKVGVERARARGVRIGRPPKLTDQDRNMIARMRAAGIKPEEIASMMQIARGTVFRILREQRIAATL